MLVMLVQCCLNELVRIGVCLGAIVAVASVKQCQGPLIKEPDSLRRELERHNFRFCSSISLKRGVLILGD